MEQFKVNEMELFTKGMDKLFKMGENSRQIREVLMKISELETGREDLRIKVVITEQDYTRKENRSYEKIME